jgi:hypothetical protein
MKAIRIKQLLKDMNSFENKKGVRPKNSIDFCCKSSFGKTIDEDGGDDDGC